MDERRDVPVKTKERRSTYSLTAIAVVGILASLALFAILAYPVGVLGMLIVLWLAIPIAIYFLYHRRRRSQRELPG